MVKSLSFTHQDVLALKYGYRIPSMPMLSVHLYYVDGLLIDTGQSRARQQILNDTNDLEIEQIFITHHHEDHSGNALEIAAKHQIPIFASPLCCELMTDPPKISFAQKMTWGDRPPNNQLQPIEDTIETPKYQFQIIKIPGHAPDMVALYEPKQGWLFSADLYINSYIDYFLFDESMAQQIESMKRILDLEFDVMFCNHKPQFENPKESLARKLNFFETFFHDVSIQYNRGLNEKQIFKQLKLKENWLVKYSSGGQLSKLNMVRSVIQDISNSPKT